MARSDKLWPPQHLHEEVALKRNYMDMPAVIQLKAIAAGISISDLANAIFQPLQRDLREQLFTHGQKFSNLLYTQSQRFSSRPDFRCNLAYNLLPEAPWNDTNTSFIQRRLELDADAFPDHVQEARQRLTGDDLALLEQRISELPSNYASNNMPDATSVAGMYRYIWLELGRRVYKMLDQDVASGKLIVTGEGDNAFVFLDDLVAWANGRRIIVEQEALPGCTSIVADAYARLRQRLAIAAITAAESPGTSKSNRSAPAHHLAVAEVRKPVSRADAQDSAILAAIKKRNVDPTRLPPVRPGEKTIKALVRPEMLYLKELFQSGRIFDTAWQRLRNQGRIRNETSS